MKMLTLHSIPMTGFSHGLLGAAGSRIRGPKTIPRARGCPQPESLGRTARNPRTKRFALLSLPPVLSAGLLVLLFAGCAAPIGADRVNTRQAYAQVEENALRTGKPSAMTVAILHRFDLDRLAARQPDEAVRQLHQKALATGERDYYLGAALYAWLFLFAEREEAPPGFLDRRLRESCAFYNYGLGLALTEHRSTNATVRLESGRHRLPVGAIELKLNLTHFPERLEVFEQILLADQFRVRGLSVRNQLIPLQPFSPGRIPVVFVHGTFSGSSGKLVSEQGVMIV